MTQVPKLKRNKRHPFLCRPEGITGRFGNYERQEAIMAKWVYRKAAANDLGTANLRMYTFYDIPKNKFIINENGKPTRNQVYIYDVMSAANWMYRLSITFLKPPIMDNHYKAPWLFPLVHKATGVSAIMTEWKGSISFITNVYHPKGADKEFINDLLELLDYLVSYECAHTYSHLVAGAIA
jgi:hypothetical protein